MLLNNTEAAKYCGISLKQFRMHVDQGHVKVIKTGKTAKSYRYRVKSLDEFLDSLEGYVCPLEKQNTDISLKFTPQVDELDELLRPKGKRRNLRVV